MNESNLSQDDTLVEIHILADRFITLHVKRVALKISEGIFQLFCNTYFLHHIHFAYLKAEVRISNRQKGACPRKCRLMG